MCRNPDADIMRDIVQLLRERIEQGLLTIFIKIKANRGDPLCLSYHFPCALQLKEWGILNEVKCRLCEEYYKEKNIRDPPDSVQSVGHIQCYCLVLQLPRIAFHHGIRRELMFSIRKSSTELNNVLEPNGTFPQS